MYLFYYYKEDFSIIISEQGDLSMKYVDNGKRYFIEYLLKNNNYIKTK